MDPSPNSVISGRSFLYINIRKINVSSDGNSIKIDECLYIDSVRLVLASIHQLCFNRHYKDIVIDFSLCQEIDPGAALAILSRVSSCRLEDIDFEIILPSKNELKRLFTNTNWVHFLEPDTYYLNQYRDYGNMRVVNFNKPTDQESAVNSIVSTLLGALERLSRKNFAAFEWAINEVTDNVLNHSSSPTGGFVQVSTFPRRKKVQIVVCDGGQGIPATLKQDHPDISSDTEALDTSIREGVTRNKALGQGNGLYGFWSISTVSNTRFSINYKIFDKFGQRMPIVNAPHAGLISVLSAFKI